MKYYICILFPAADTCLNYNIYPMAFDFYNKYQHFSDQELLHIIGHPDQYQEAAIVAAQTLLEERGTDITSLPAEEHTPSAEDTFTEDLSTLLSSDYRSSNSTFRSLYEAFSTAKGNRPLLLFKIVMAIYILTYAYQMGLLFFSGNLSGIFYYDLYYIGLLCLEILLPLLLLLFLNRLSTAAWVIFCLSIAYSGSVQFFTLLQLGIMGFSGDAVMSITWLGLGGNIFGLYTITIPYNRQLFRVSKRTMLITILVAVVCGIISAVINYYSYEAYMESIPDALKDL